jgi:hypothetical protein
VRVQYRAHNFLNDTIKSKRNREENLCVVWFTKCNINNNGNNSHSNTGGNKFE